MKKNTTLFSLLFTTVFLPLAAQQSKPVNELRWNLNEDGSRYFKMTLFSQIWIRNTQLNPGSSINNYPVSNLTDIGIRRTRIQAYGQISKNVFLYSQFGMNNYTSNSPRFSGAYFHDVLAEYKIYKDVISAGGGLTGWSGLSRYASPSIGSIMTLDAPLYQQATNSTTDQFLRKLSVYAKGKISRLDYRIALTNPMNANNGVPNGTKTDTGAATFSSKPPHMQTQAYLKWEFFDREANTIPYLAGCYLGTKKVFNIGAGFIHQADAMRQKGSNAGDTNTYTAMMLWNVDAFLDLPLNKDKGNAVTVYAAYTNYNFGTNYLRMNGVMNPVTSKPYTGDAYAMIGTGTTMYAQAGYLFGKKLLPGDCRFQLFAAAQYSKYQAKKDPMLMTETGFNLFVNGTHNNKISFVYQNRPIYGNANGSQTVTERKGMFVLQLQAGI